MNRYHVNPATGSAGKCRAEISCPFGDLESDHYDTMALARKAFEVEQSRLAPMARLRRKAAPSSRRRESNVDPKHGFLRREIAEAIVIQDVNCSACGKPITAEGARAFIGDNYADCPCGHENSLEELNIVITPANSSYKFLDKQAVKDAVWYHSTDDDKWLETVRRDDYFSASSYKGEGFLAHVGTEAAAFDRAITNFAPHGATTKNFYMYEVRLDPSVTIADEIAEDDNSDSSLNGDEDVTRYINRWEDMASISLGVDSTKLHIVGKRLVTPKEAHERVSIYNVPAAEDVEDYWDD